MFFGILSTLPYFLGEKLHAILSKHCEVDFRLVEASPRWHCGQVIYFLITNHFSRREDGLLGYSEGSSPSGSTGSNGSEGTECQA